MAVTCTSPGGKLLANGTEAEPILFTSADKEPLAGDWGCVLLESSAESELEHVVFEHGGAACNADGHLHTSAVVINASLRKFRDIQVRQSSGHGVMMLDTARSVRDFADVRFRDIEFTSLRVTPESMNSLKPAVEVDADDEYIEVDAGGVIDVSTAVSWRNLGVPYRLQGRTKIWAPVTIEAGTVFQLSSGIEILDEGSLKSIGTVDAPIVWTSAKQDPVQADRCWRSPASAPNHTSNSACGRSQSI